MATFLPNLVMVGGRRGGVDKIILYSNIKDSSFGSKKKGFF